MDAEAAAAALRVPCQAFRTRCFLYMDVNNLQRHQRGLNQASAPPAGCLCVRESSAGHLLPFPAAL